MPVLYYGGERDARRTSRDGRTVLYLQFVRVRGATKTEIGRLNVPVAMGGNFIILPRRRRDGCRWFIIP